LIVPCSISAGINPPERRVSSAAIKPIANKPGQRTAPSWAPANTPACRTAAPQNGRWRPALPKKTLRNATSSYIGTTSAHNGISTNGPPSRAAARSMSKVVRPKPSSQGPSFVASNARAMPKLSPCTAKMPSALSATTPQMRRVDQLQRINRA
jgi:hypothetical protein